MKLLFRPAAFVAAAMITAGCAAKSKPPTPTAAAPTAATTVTTSTPDAMATLATMAATAEPKPEVLKKAPKPWYMTVLSVPASITRIFPKKSRPPQAQPPRLLGVIKMVNKQDGFVLIDAISQSSAPGDLLVCITNQQETANLRMSNLKNPPFLIADIASGNPSPGDRVFIP